MRPHLTSAAKAPQLGEQLHSSSVEVVDTTNDTYILVVDERFQNGWGGFKFFNVQLDVAADRVCKEIAGHALNGTYRRGKSCDQPR